MGMTGQQGQMTAYLHFSPLSDTLWFQYWVPSSAGALFGACIGLFLLAIFERWIAAGRAIAEQSWHKSAQLAMEDKLEGVIPSASPAEPKSAAKTQQLDPVRQTESRLLKVIFPGMSIPPFIPSHDISRGILQFFQTLLMYLFMLAIMTFQLSFLISISIGAGVGEMMFGRYISGSSHH